MHHDYEALAALGGDQRFELLNGRRTRTGAPVLLKRPRHLPAAGADVAALQREYAIAAGLPCAAALLPRLIDGPPAPLLVMEHPGGALLSERCAGSPLPVDAVLAIGRQVAEALAQLHDRGLVHLGLRPEVILWRADDRRAWLIDFADAGLPGARPVPDAQGAGAPHRLVYMSPEQTGRIEHPAGPRGDLYALGIVLFELLTGAPPFRSPDPLEQIHWHIAGTARAPVLVDPAIPPVLSDLVMKLLAKSPDARYQSANGLAQDLARCAVEWSAHGCIAPFELGRNDFGAHLVVSQRLVGRTREVHALLQAFERACQGEGGGTLLLVEGYSGIGKTALIQQLYRPIVRHKGYFISGKFDQLMRGIPFGALIQAFRGLVRQLLGESESRLASWRATLLAALGANGGVLAEVIPEITFIIGPQPAPVALGSTEAQNRFQRVLENFLAALAQPEHPLVLFLDDLQWADAATLGILEPLLTSPAIRCLLVMGALRDNELDTAPRLARALGALAAARVRIERVALGPLQLADLTELVAETLHASPSHAAPLARLVHGKTGGNPFFVIQFLKLLEREGHLHFDPAHARWVYRLEDIAGAPLADNVIDLMTRSIQRLPPKSQYALTLAACIGNRFDASTLAVVSEQSAAATAQDLAQAAAEGLIVNAGEDGRFAFLHDRVQQAAYALIPAERRQMVHLTVGRLLRSRATAEQLEAGLFDIVHHLNLGRALITGAAERRAVAELNLAAGRRAKASTAQDAAIELFDASLDLLGANAWNEHAALSFELHLEAAESRYLCGQSDLALQALGVLVERAGTPIDRARALRLRSVQYENLARYTDALASAREGLALFGVSFPDREADKAAALEQAIGAIDALRGERPIATLIDLPLMTDAATRMVMAMLTDIWSAAYIVGDPTLARLISATLVRLSLEHGNVAESAYGYVTHAITVGPVRGAYQAAYEYGRLALAVNERFDDARRRAKIQQQFQAHVNLWCQPLRTCMAYAREACRSGLESGDFLYAAYGAGTEPWSAMVTTQDLAQFVRDYTPSVALIEKLNNVPFADSVRVLLNWARALQGSTAAPLSLSDVTLDEAAWLRTYRDNPFFSSIHAVVRLQLAVLLGTPAQALQAAQHAAALVSNVPGTVWPVVHEFWHALALAADLPRGTPAEAVDAVEAMAANAGDALDPLRLAQAAFQSRAAFCAENFLCQAHLLAAEIARIEGRDRDAAERYEQAIEFAAAGPLLQLHALAHELCGRFRLQRGQRQLAALHLAQARECYAQWGALAKVEALEREHAGLLARAGAPAALADEAPRAPADAARSDAAAGLDLISVLKATQAIAAEVELPGLLARLMHIAQENAGAERGALILEGDGGPLVYTTGIGPVALEGADNVPIGIVNYVRRTAGTVVLDCAEIQAATGARSDDEHGADPYVQRHRPRSLAALPVRKLGQSIGVLYLEHRGVSAIFTPARLSTLQVLAMQAAILLENARLVGGLKHEIAERQRAQEGLGAALAEVQRLKENLEAENSYLRRDLVANVSHDLRTPLAAMRGYLEVLATQGDGLAPEQRREYLGIAVRQSEHLATLVESLFELAKLDFNGVTLRRERFAFGELATDVMHKFRLAAQGCQVALRVEVPSQLPFVDADLSLIERVLENLIGNALQHTPAGGQVRVCARVEGDGLLAEVSDTGSGIASEALPFVFERFYRCPNRHGGSTDGAGLGLAITRRILELHGTGIRAENCADAGARFLFTLPLHGAPHTPARAQDASSDRTTTVDAHRARPSGGSSGMSHDVPAPTPITTGASP